MDDSKASKSDVESKIIDAFKVFDDGNTGKITGADLKHVMTSIGEKLTAEQADGGAPKRSVVMSGTKKVFQVAQAVPSRGQRVLGQ